MAKEESLVQTSLPSSVLYIFCSANNLKFNFLKQRLIGLLE